MHPSSLKEHGEKYNISRQTDVLRLLIRSLLLLTTYLKILLSTGSGRFSTAIFCVARWFVDHSAVETAIVVPKELSQVLCEEGYLLKVPQIVLAYHTLFGARAPPPRTYYASWLSSGEGLGARTPNRSVFLPNGPLLCVPFSCRLQYLLHEYAGPPELLRYHHFLG